MRVVDGEKFYSPREIADLGLITNSKGKPDYNFVLRLIKRGELKYTILNPESQIEYKFVPESSINQYNSRFSVKSS